MLEHILTPHMSGAFSTVPFPLLAFPFRDGPITLSHAATAQIIPEPLIKQKGYDGSNNREYHSIVPGPTARSPEPQFGPGNAERFRGMDLAYPPDGDCTASARSAARETEHIRGQTGTRAMEGLSGIVRYSPNHPRVT